MGVFVKMLPVLLAALCSAGCVLEADSPGTTSIGRSAAKSESSASGSCFTASQYVYLDLTRGTVSEDNASWTEISTSKTPLLGGTVKVDYTTGSSGSSTGLIRINATAVTANTAIRLSGTMTAGGVKIQTSTSYETGLYLDGASITSSSYPCIELTKGGAVSVFLTGDNTLTDGRSYGIGYGEEYSTSSGSTYIDDDGDTVSCTTVKAAETDGSDAKGALFCKGDMTLCTASGGTLSVTQGYKHCIASKSILTVESGTYTLTSTGKHGLHGDQGVVMAGGTVTFNGTGAISASEFRKATAIKTDGDDYPDSYIKVTGGTLSITTYNGKGLAAPKVYISGGTNTLAVTGVSGYTNDSSNKSSYYDADGVYYANQSVTFAAEGIEGGSTVEISGGTTAITATDDGINASSAGASLTISGGSTYVCAEKGDGLDSNGNLTISGGTLVSIATTGSEDALDSGDGYTLTISGGLVAGYQGSAQSESAALSQVLARISSGSAGSAGASVAVTDASGSVVYYAATIPSEAGKYSIMILTSPDLDSSYTVYTGCTFSGGTHFHGLYTSLPDVSGGTSIGTVSTYSSSSSSFSGGSGGTTGNGPGGTGGPGGGMKH